MQDRKKLYVKVIIACSMIIAETNGACVSNVLDFYICEFYISYSEALIIPYQHMELSFIGKPSDMTKRASGSFSLYL